MRKVLGLLMFVLAVKASVAGGGMWIPLLLEQLNEKEMMDKGMRLTAEDLYSINHSSLKDGIVHFDGGCTAEVVSDQGLILTNHHCGFDAIQKHSSVKHDYLTDGFWAMKKEDELRNRDMTATFIVRIEDVTKAVKEGVSDDLREEDQAKLIQENIKKIIEEAVKDTHYEAKIKPFFYGNDYYMFITETFTDIRLVGAPPESIGRFGGDTDNWMWPRHNADFSLFRIYADKDNKPATYSRENVPYKPKHHFPISTKGVKKGDFTMIYGFPGRTSEYLTSDGVDYVLNKSNPAKIAYREKVLDILDVSMSKSTELRIKYASKAARVSNAYKKWIGQNKGLDRFRVIERKERFDKEMALKISHSPEFKEKYKDLMPSFKQVYKDRESYQFARDYFVEFVYYGSDLMNFMRRFRRPVQKIVAYHDNKVPNMGDYVESLRKQTTEFFRNFDLETDKKLFAATLEMYEKAMTDKSKLPDVFDLIKKKYKGDYKAYTDYVYEKTIFVDRNEVFEFLSNFEKKNVTKKAKDPAYVAMESVLSKYYLSVRPELVKINAQLDKLYRGYIEAQRGIFKDRAMYPDANSTLRVAYGKVDGYKPRDGVKYGYYTTIDGIMQKFDSTNKDFVLPSKLVELYENKDYGPYTHNGELRVCFTASNHTTGGNSGSPVINADGQLIGLNFDRTWESTMSDLYYNANICRNIAVDINYVLFIIDKFAGAKHLVDEMELIDRKSELEKLVETSTKAIAVDSMESKWYNDRGLAYFELGEFHNAYDDFQHASTLSPKVAKYYYNMGSTQVHFNEIPQANKSFSKAIELEHDYIEAYYNRGKTYADLAKYELAIADFNHVILMDPNHARAYNNRGVAKNILWGNREGCEDIEHAMKLGSVRAKKTFKNWCK